MISVGFDCSAVDPSFKSHAHRGIGRYVSRLRSAFDVAQEPDISVGFFDHTSLSRTGLADRMVNSLPMGRTPLRQHILYPSRLNDGALKNYSLLHYPAHMDAPAWSAKPYVLTVLDLIPHLLSELYRANKPSWRFRAARALEVRAIRQATMLLAISEATANDIVRLLDIPRDRIVVTPLGVDEQFHAAAAVRGARTPEWSAQLRGRLGLPHKRPIILYVGGHDERKNIDVVVEVARRAINEMSSNPPVLVLAGRITSPLEQERLTKSLARHSMINDTVNLGYVSDVDLNLLYGESSVFLFPTLYEGFGLPALEAMATGLPVVSSNTSSLPEVVGSAGVLFDPTNVSQGTEGVLNILRDSAMAEALSLAGIERARQFTWERTVKATYNGYREAYARLGLDRSVMAESAPCCRRSVRVEGE
jgi:glycosyltransferase involved in cell wall biosynthesis